MSVVYTYLIDILKANNMIAIFWVIELSSYNNYFMKYYIVVIQNKEGFF